MRYIQTAEGNFRFARDGVLTSGLREIFAAGMSLGEELPKVWPRAVIRLFTPPSEYHTGEFAIFRSGRPALFSDLKAVA